MSVQPDEQKVAASAPTADQDLTVFAASGEPHSALFGSIERGKENKENAFS